MVDVTLLKPTSVKFRIMNCVVIGAGLLGLTSAWYLSLLGYKVKVFECNSDVALETSFANGGMLHASEASPWNHPGILLEALKMLGKRGFRPFD